LAGYFYFFNVRKIPYVITRSAKTRAIGSLSIFTYDWLPLDYYVIIDSTDVVFGRYIPDPDDPSYLQTKNACHVHASDMSSQEFINQHIESFDKMVEHGKLIGLHLVSKVEDGVVAQNM